MKRSRRFWDSIERIMAVKTPGEIQARRAALFAKYPQETARARLEYRADPKLRKIVTEDEFAFGVLADAGLVDAFAMGASGGNMAIQIR